jgi:hypothetical protein
VKATTQAACRTSHCKGLRGLENGGSHAQPNPLSAQRGGKKKAPSTDPQKSGTEEFLSTLCVRNPAFNSFQPKKSKKNGSPQEHTLAIGLLKGKNRHSSVSQFKSKGHKWFTQFLTQQKYPLFVFVRLQSNRRRAACEWGKGVCERVKGQGCALRECFCV